MVMQSDVRVIAFSGVFVSTVAEFRHLCEVFSIPDYFTYVKSFYINVLLLL